MNSLRLCESKCTKKGCLGRLEGICADFKNPTRNGRLYPLGLWKRVFDDALFKESLQNKTLFGELDHPEERFEPLISEACVVMTDYRIDEDAGVIYGGFDILDTPKGRILKSIVDYGSVVGVSSRGQGDIIESVNGEEVDEDSYDFACFDVVSTPAVEKARQAVTESIKKTNFKESVERQIRDAETVADLNIIRSVIRTSDIEKSDMDTIIESIEDKCNTLQNAGNTISAEKNTSKPLTESAKTISDKDRRLHSCINGLRKQLSAYKHREKRYVESLSGKDAMIKQLKSDLSAERKRLSGIKADSKRQLTSVTESYDDRLAKSKQSERRLKDRVDKTLSEKQDLRRQLQSIEDSYESKIASLTERIRAKEDQISSLEDELSTSTENLKLLESENRSLKSSHNSEIRQIDSEVDEYSNLLTEAQEKIASGNNTISELKETVKSYQGKLKKKDEALSVVQSNLKQFQEMYTKTVADFSGIDPDSIYHSITNDTTPKQIDTLVEQYRQRIDRYNKLGISNTGLLESSNISIDTMKRNEEDERLMNLLIATQNSL
jgi:uncharacterized protein YukE